LENPAVAKQHWAGQYGFGAGNKKGKIIFDGKDISGITTKEMRQLRKEMQIIFQDPYSSLNPRKKIGDAIAEPMLVHQLFKTEKKEKTK
jgi:ABC-type microcin C transport system duplicated ATPase subunit YejF